MLLLRSFANDKSKTCFILFHAVSSNLTINVGLDVGLV